MKRAAVRSTGYATDAIDPASVTCARSFLVERLILPGTGRLYAPRRHLSL